jgi:hypothetical protein
MSRRLNVTASVRTTTSPLTANSYSWCFRPELVREAESPRPPIDPEARNRKIT